MLPSQVCVPNTMTPFLLRRHSKHLAPEYHRSPPSIPQWQRWQGSRLSPPLPVARDRCSPSFARFIFRRRKRIIPVHNMGPS